MRGALVAVTCFAAAGCGPGPRPPPASASAAAETPNAPGPAAARTRTCIARAHIEGREEDLDVSEQRVREDASGTIIGLYDRGLWSASDTQIAYDEHHRVVSARTVQLGRPRESTSIQTWQRDAAGHVVRETLVEHLPTGRDAMTTRTTLTVVDARDAHGRRAHEARTVDGVMARDETVSRDAQGRRSRRVTREPAHAAAQASVTTEAFDYEETSPRPFRVRVATTKGSHAPEYTTKTYDAAGRLVQSDSPSLTFRMMYEGDCARTIEALEVLEADD